MNFLSNHIRELGSGGRLLHSSAILLGKYGSNKKFKGSLSSKHMPSGWYKGSGGRTLGRHTKKGRFILDDSKVPQFVVPTGLDVFPLKPYVSKKTPLIKVPPPNYDELLTVMIEQHTAAWKEQQAEKLQQQQSETTKAADDSKL